MLWLMVTAACGSVGGAVTVEGLLVGVEQPISPDNNIRVKIGDHLTQQDLFIFIVIPGDFPWFSIV